MFGLLKSMHTVLPEPTAERSAATGSPANVGSSAAATPAVVKVRLQNGPAATACTPTLLALSTVANSLAITGGATLLALAN